MSQCPWVTRKGRPCSTPGESRRDGYCHVHDPDGTFAKQHPKYRARVKTKAAMAPKWEPDPRIVALLGCW
jgi:hypothetical protein